MHRINNMKLIVSEKLWTDILENHFLQMVPLASDFITGGQLLLLLLNNNNNHHHHHISILLCSIAQISQIANKHTHFVPWKFTLDSK